MEDESAEIELLEQNLRKTHSISQRMTTILASFDTRLAKLEKSIRPLYDTTQVLNRRASNIDRALLKIVEVASRKEGVEVEATLILRGPQPGQFAAYRDALERLNATIAFKTSGRDSHEAVRLVETGVKKVTQLYTKLVAEGSSGPLPFPGAEIHVGFPNALYAAIQPLVAFLRTLPLPATHPSHPAAPTIMSTLQEAQRGYADMRGTWCRRCLDVQARRVIDRADTIDAVEAGREVGMWVDNLLRVAETEYSILDDLAPLPHSDALASAYSSLLMPLTTLFTTTLTSFISLVKRSLHQYGFLALAAYDSLAALQPRWDSVHMLRSPASREANEFKDGFLSLRAVCLRSFPEFLADLKIAAMSKAGESTGLADFTLSTVDYLDRLPEVQSAVGAALVTLGDGNWKMGEGLQPASGSKYIEDDESILLEHFTYDVINTILSSLTTLSKANKRPAFGSIFLFNNVGFLLQRLVVAPQTLELPSMLSQPTVDLLNSNFRIAKAGYFDSNFSPLLQALTDDPKETRGVIGTGKSSTKEKLTKFFDLLEEVSERHKMARVLEDGEYGREQIADEVVKLVVLSLQGFMQKHRDKNPQKYMKLSAEGVESQIRGLYR